LPFITGSKPSLRAVSLQYGKTECRRLTHNTVYGKLGGCWKTRICGVALILRHCDVRSCTPHSSEFRAPCICTFSNSLQSSSIPTGSSVPINCHNLSGKLIILWSGFLYPVKVPGCLFIQTRLSYLFAEQSL
jgi:hypothetical protein